MRTIVAVLFAASSLFAQISPDPKRTPGAVNPEIMLPGNDFKQRMSQYVREMKALPKQPGVSEIRIPSERASEERERRRHQQH